MIFAVFDPSPLTMCINCSFFTYMLIVVGVCWWCVVQYGRCIYVSGQIALNPASMTLIDGDTSVQCRLALQHVHRVLSVMSSDVCLCDSLIVICYVTSHDAAVAAQTDLNKALASSSHTSIVSTDCSLSWAHAVHGRIAGLENAGRDRVIDCSQL